MRVRFSRCSSLPPDPGWWLRYVADVYPIWDNDPMKYLRKALR